MVGKAARIFGLVFVLIGILGFVPPALKDGMLLGLFPVSTLHNIVHLLLGLWGLAVANSPGNATTYFRIIAVIFAGLAVLGYFHPMVDLGGMLLPLGGNDVILHAVLAVAAAYFGFMGPRRAMVG